MTNDPSFFDAPGYLPPRYDLTGDGVIFTLSRVTKDDITDGMSNTYLLGEKYLIPDDWMNGLEGTDNNPIYAGFDWDWERWAGNGVIRDQPGRHDWVSFGSAHATGVNMIMCDGSAHGISYSIDMQTHTNLCCRNDGQTIDWTKAGY